MSPALPSEAAEFGAAAEKAFTTAGGADLAREAELDHSLRAGRVAGLLRGLGAGELDPREDLDTAAAAGELCRAAGRVALPYPVAGLLLGTGEGGGRPFATVPGPSAWRADHGDLFDEWRVAGLDGVVSLAVPEGRPLGSRLGPFVTDLSRADGDAGLPGSADVRMHLTLSAWRMLGVAERAVELAAEHVRGREQFGQPLSAFQAVQFQLADAATAVDGLRELCRFTLWRLFDDPDAAMSDALALRLHALDVGRATLRTSQQLHGASGYCDEYDISVLCRHAQADLRLPFGAERCATELFEAVRTLGFESLFPQGARRRPPAPA